MASPSPAATTWACAFCAPLPRAVTPPSYRAEMGGKNPTIITNKADLDKAAMGVMRSAFGLQGQNARPAPASTFMRM
ncbi:aldehyde dehydrogenase family protein [Candidatus Amarobacter glycogenicus]|uniref:aldehyde dehydrogenase family protein n=1 Tax=Candidatus Amarobacter glycogenicus TaxID=3140699 RepID=UPI0031CCA8FB